MKKEGIIFCTKNSCHKTGAQQVVVGFWPVCDEEWESSTKLEDSVEALAWLRYTSECVSYMGFNITILENESDPVWGTCWKLHSSDYWLETSSGVTL